MLFYNHLMIYYNLLSTITRIPNKFFVTYSFANQFFAFTSEFIFIPTFFVITYT